MARRPWAGLLPGLTALALTLAQTGHSQGAQPGVPAAPADAELLEFLGGADVSADGGHPDDGAWMEYLSRTDINRVARADRPPVRAAAAGAPPVPANSPAAGSQP